MIYRESGMIELDGSKGGGSLVRTALTLSALWGTSIRIENIRGARPNPGLRPQHLAAVQAMAEVCDADVSGAAVEARSMTFEPRELHGGTIEVDIGTAGSMTLLFDALLPLAVGLEAPLLLTVTGGTDVKWSPSSAYFKHAKLPLLQQVGLNAEVSFERTGFYPAGGGKGLLRIEPSTLQPLKLTQRGAFEGARVYSKASAVLEKRSVADRQADAAIKALTDAGLEVVERAVSYPETESTGSAIGICLDYEHTTAGFDSLGERGKPAEEVGGAAAGKARAFYSGPASVDEHMADQLLVFLALGGGEVVIPHVTEHVETGRRLLEAYDVHVSLESRAGGTVLVRHTPVERR